MINLIYVVLLAMMALNVSSEVLDGFGKVDDGLMLSLQNEIQQNEAFYDKMECAMHSNPDKTRVWYNMAIQLRQESKQLFSLTEYLKEQMVKDADGKKGDVRNIQHRDNVEATTRVMLQFGDSLKKAIDSYRISVLNMTENEQLKKNVTSGFNTDVPINLMGKNWQEYQFENVPVAAAVVQLSKLQMDICNIEGTILQQLLDNIDVKDVRVNEIQALVIPNAQTVVRGGKFSAQIIMAAVDTTQRPEIYIGNTLLKSEHGRYETICGSTGDFTLKGYLIMKNGNGETIRREFSQPYTVVEPSATVSATLMNMLYAGYQNPISVSVPGIPNNRINLSMTNGTLTKKDGGNYVAVPSKVGEDVTFTVTAQNEGRQQEMGKFTFHVRKLPDPTPFLLLKDEKGNTVKYTGGVINKASLANIEQLHAAIDDGFLEVPFQVTGFETVFFDGMGNAVPLSSDKQTFTNKQKETFRKLSRNKRFYISHIHVTGSDGIARTLNNSMEVITK